MWSEGIIYCPSTGSKYKYWVKHYEESSPFGIDGGKISKLTIRKVGETRDLCNYDRGWDIEPGALPFLADSHCSKRRRSQDKSGIAMCVGIGKSPRFSIF